MPAPVIGPRWIPPVCAAGIAGGLSMDYYGTYYHKSFDVNETKCYQVDARPVGKPGLLVGSAMSDAATSFTCFFPSNGDILRARPVPDSEHWFQLLGGSYVQGRHCGVTVLREVPCPETMGSANMVRGAPLPPMLSDNTAS